MRKSFAPLLAMALLLSLAACSALQDKGASPAPSPVAKPAPMGAYQEFEDVLIPKEMEINEKTASVIQTPNFKSGMLTYTGHVDPISLSNFFETNMVQDNWKLRSKMRYQTRTLLVFEKVDRDCIINIEDKTFNTYMEVIVAQHLTTGAQSAPQFGISAPAAKSPSPQSPFEENLAK